MNYRNDKFGAECLRLSENSKGGVKFGAILVKNGRILGRGWNRLATKEERSTMRYVDYCVHAEQAAILDALQRHKSLSGGTIFVLGTTKSGALTTRKEKIFVCRKCPNNLKEFGLSVHIPYIRGWRELTAEQAHTTGKQLWGKGYWNKFIKGVL